MNTNANIDILKYFQKCSMKLKIIFQSKIINHLPLKNNVKTNKYVYWLCFPYLDKSNQTGSYLSYRWNCKVPRTEIRKKSKGKEMKSTQGQRGQQVD